MTHVFFTAVPLDSNFLLEEQEIAPVNFELDSPIKRCCYPIIPIMSAAAAPDDKVKLVVVRQTNSPESRNYQSLLRELNALRLDDVTVCDCPIPENQDRDMLLALFEKLMAYAEPDACYHACMTFGTKTYPIVLFSVLSYIEKIVPNTEICGIYYREIRRSEGKIAHSATYDMTALFSLNRIVDTVANMDCADKEEMIRLLLKTGA